MEELESEPELFGTPIAEDDGFYILRINRMGATQYRFYIKQDDAIKDIAACLEANMSSDAIQLYCVIELDKIGELHEDLSSHKIGWNVIASELIRLKLHQP